MQIVNLRQFQSNIKRRAEKIKLTVLVVQKKVALDLFVRLVERTPIDTGRAMNNWNMSLTSVDRSTVDVGGNQFGIIASKAAEAELAVNNLDKLGIIWISNSLPYIMELERGSSGQAPSGWIMLSVDEITAELRRL